MSHMQANGSRWALLQLMVVVLPVSAFIVGHCLIHTHSEECTQ